MGMTAALKLRRVVDNTRWVLAIEAMAASQALDLMAPLTTSSRGQVARAAIRSVSPKLEKDRAMYQDFVKIAQLIANGKIREALE